jgi:hypothetical protein
MAIILPSFRGTRIIFEWLQEEAVLLVTLTLPHIYLLIQGQMGLLEPTALVAGAAVQLDTQVMAVTVEHVLVAHLKPVVQAGHMVAPQRMAGATVAPAVQAQALTQVVMQVAMAQAAEEAADQALIIRHPRVVVG